MKTSDTFPLWRLGFFYYSFFLFSTSSSSFALHNSRLPIYSRGLFYLACTPSTTPFRLTIIQRRPMKTCLPSRRLASIPWLGRGRNGRGGAAQSVRSP
ncbi:hypothetical protein F5X99DRAFT_369528 [Biscogniauxia marginata]|nr:hypothetical protein F5X99DRAFT_369528 [Biscogniauxia marginata]